MTSSAEAVTRSSIESAVEAVYAKHPGPMANADLYSAVAEEMGVQMELFETREPVGNAGKTYCLPARHARWVQQTLKLRGLIERVDRGKWRVTAEGREKLRRPIRGQRMIALSTDLGLAVWGDCRDVFSDLPESSITLCLTSPPYPIRKGRAYGRINESAYVDWLCAVLEPVIAKLVPGGNLALVVGNDVFEQGSPARSLYQERLILALADRFDLSLMDRLIWHNPSKAPGPVRWASMKRCQLNAGYEWVLWFTNEPARVCADNRRVLEAHSERHQSLMAAGGERRATNTSDGAYRLRPGSFSNVTEGRIPRNVLTYGHACAGQRRYRQAANDLGLPRHGAPAPLSLGRFLTRFLSEPGSLCADPMAGSLTFPESAELEGRRWLASERYGEYLRGGLERFAGYSGFTRNPDFEQVI
ncbi:MAG: DNA methyltransferase [Salinisphaeraceae bacterium]